MSRLFALLLQVIQRQDAEIEALRRKVKNQSRYIQHLQSYR